MKIDEHGNVIVDTAQPLQDLGDYFHRDYDDVAHDRVDELNKGDEDEQMAELLNY